MDPRLGRSLLAEAIGTFALTYQMLRSESLAAPAPIADPAAEREPA